MINIMIDEGSDGHFYVHKSGKQWGFRTRDEAIELAERLFKEAGGKGHAVIKDLSSTKVLGHGQS